MLIKLRKIKCTVELDKKHILARHPVWCIITWLKYKYLMVIDTGSVNNHRFIDKFQSEAKCVMYFYKTREATPRTLVGF